VIQNKRHLHKMLVNFDLYQIILYAFAIFSLTFWIGVRFVHLMAVIYGKWRLHKKHDLQPKSLEQSLPGVSILKPLCTSDDPFLFSNLETFFTLSYPGKYEIIFCIEDESDNQLRLYINSLKSKYPHVDTQTFFGGEKVGVNPKVNNMHPGYRAAKYELILVSDCRIRMKPDTLLDMVSCMTRNVGLVHQMPFSCDRNGIPAASLEKIHFGTCLARMYLAANVIGINCAAGMSELIKKDILEASGGLKAFGNYLAEDYFFAQAVLNSGHSINISSQPAWQNSGNGGVSVFQSRITRWTKLRSAMCPLTTIFEPFSECMVLGAMTAWSVLFLFRWDPLAFFFVHLLLWFIMDWALLLVVQNDSLPFNKFEFLVMWLFREVSSPYLFVLAQIDPDIKWRAHSFRLKFGGIAELREQVRL